MRIKQLPPLLANQIAAGEVIERPASVVKELLENSIDAKSKHITVEIEKGGKQSILIRDDGLGIHPDDLPLAVSSHATSKIHSVDDLIQINSLGFRGEALASIGSVSTLKITSRRREDDIATKIEVTSSTTDVLTKSAAHPVGTTVEVHHLFYNTPARRKFLRSEQTEFSHIETVVQRIALSHFDCGLTLKHHNKIIFNLGKAHDQINKDRRVAKLFGQAFMNEARFIDTSAAGLRLWGWLGLPSFSRSQTDLQFFYINGRMVRDKLINLAIRKAYQDLLFEGRHPAYILHLEIDPTEVDVNVHPTKHEVRFQQPRLIHDFLFSRLHDIINGEQPITLTFPENKVAQEGPSYEISRKSNPISTIERPLASLTSPLDFFGKIIGLFQQDYLLTETSNGMMIIHLPSAQRIIFSTLYEKALENNSLQIQPLLFPQRIELDESLLDCLQQHTEKLCAFGLPMERIAENCCIVRELPQLLAQADLTNLYKNLAIAWQLKPDMSLSLELIAEYTITASNPKQQLDILRQMEELDLAKPKKIAHFCKFIPTSSLVRSSTLS